MNVETVVGVGGQIAQQNVDVQSQVVLNKKRTEIQLAWKRIWRLQFKVNHSALPRPNITRKPSRVGGSNLKCHAYLPVFEEMSTAQFEDRRLSDRFSSGGGGENRPSGVLLSHTLCL